MITTIFGINRVVNWIRAGTGICPMIGPRTRPRNRSMIVQPAPNATWKKVSGHNVLTAIATIRPISTTAAIASPARGTIWKSGISIGPWSGADSASRGATGMATSVMSRILFPAGGHGQSSGRADRSGGGGIRTRGPLARTLVFKTSAFDHSATPPGRRGDASAAIEALDWRHPDQERWPSG